MKDKTLVIGLMICLMLVTVLPMVSAGKSYDEETKTYETTDWLFFKKYDIKLNNVQDSIINAYADGELIIHKDDGAKVFKKVFYKDIYGNSKDFKEGDYKIYLNQSYMGYDEVTNWDCEDYTIEHENSTIETKENCTQLPSDWVETGIKHNWIEVDYNEKIEAGHYLWKIEAKKPKNKKVDFIIETDDEGTLDEWAWWNATWEYRREISNIDGEYPTINFTKQANGDKTFNDLRFLDSTETEELNFTIRENVTDSWVTITIDTNNASSIYMYYGNTTNVETTQNAVDTFLGAEVIYFLDESGRDYSGNGYDGTFTGGQITTGDAGFIYESSEYFATDDYFNTTYLLPNNDVTLVFNVNPDTITAFNTVTGCAQDYESGGSNGIQLFWFNDTTMQVGRRSVADAYLDYPNDLDEHFLAVAYSSTNGIESYVDGDNTNTCSGSPCTSDFNSGTPFTHHLPFGAFLRKGTDVLNDYDGLVDEILIFERRLTSTEVDEIHSMSEQTDTYVLGSEEVSNQQPVVILEAPANETIVNSNGYSANFEYTPYDLDGTIQNCSLYVWNVSDDTLKYTQTDLTITNGTTNSFTQVLMASNYTWNVECIDDGGASGTNDSNWTINIIAIPDNAPNIELGLGNPNGTYSTSPQNFNFNFSNVYDDNQIENVSLVINSVLAQTNSSGANDTNYIFSESFTDGTYQYFGIVYDNATQSAQTPLTTFTIDSTAPSVTITAPANATIVTQFNQSFNLNWTIVEDNIDTCWYNTSNLYSRDDFEGSLDSWNIVSNGGDGQVVSSTDWSSYGSSSLKLKGGSAFGGSNAVVNKSYNYTGFITLDINHSLLSFTPSVTITVDGNTVYQNSTVGVVYDISFPYTAGDEMIISIGKENIVYIDNIRLVEGNYLSCSANTTTLNYPSTNPESYTVYLYANDTVGNVGSDNVTLFKPNIAPVIEIFSPLTAYAKLVGGDILDLNYTIQNASTLDSCWYSYNGVNTSLTCGENTTFSYFVSVNTITVYANDTFSNFGSETRNWNVDSVENNFIFNSTSYETKTETFIANITINTSTVVGIGAILNYDGTRYTAEANCDGPICLLETKIDVPLITGTPPENRTWFYELQLFSATSSTTTNTTSQYQQVSSIFFEICNATYTNDALNFTAFDEQTLEGITPFDFAADFQFWLGSGTVTKTNNFTQDSVSNVQLCISPDNLTYYLTGVVEYDETGTNNYTVRNYYFQNDPVTEDLQNIELGLLLSDQATSFILKLQDPDILPLPEALIYTQRFYPGLSDFKTVQVAKTDDNGKSVGFFETETADYRFIIKKNGVTLLITPDDNRSQKVVGEETPFTLTFTVGDDEGASWEIFETVDGLAGDINYNKSTNIVSFSYADSTGNFDYANFQVFIANGTGPNSLICNESLTQASGIISCNMTGNSTGSYIAKGIIWSNGLRNLVSQESFKIETFTTLSGRLGLFLGFFLILISALAFKFNEIAGILLMDAMMIFVNIIGLVNFGVTWITAWIAISIIILVVLER